MTETSTILAVALSLTGVAFVVLAGWHIWYAVGLARVLETNGVEPWRAWVPLLNDAEVMRLGRVDPVNVALLLVPFVAVYGVVLRALAAHRVNARFGRGAGATVLAVLLPPVWAMVLGGAKLVDTETSEDDDDADDAPIALVAAGVVPVGLAPGAAVPAPTALAPAPPASAWAPPPMLPAAGASVAAPPAVSPPAALVADPPAEETSIRRRSRSAGDDASGAGPRSWELVLPSGEALPITARTLVLGRKPQMRRGEAQYVTVADDTRTVSKEHAQLQWSAEGWMLTDLGSVNGVALVDAQGVEHPVAAGASAKVEGVFLLGDARLGLRRSALGR